ncbi:hypothetical protein FJY84_06690 [Candidatus Bathyarchaeota archaeon]|nr:hypothetical protein [Candidatus Bathyarchaeota archaeon]
MGKIIDIAKKLKEKDNEISILFVGDSRKLLNNQEFVDSINFVKLYSLDRYDKIIGEGIEIIDYSGWIKLLETCKKNINWI